MEIFTPTVVKVLAILAIMPLGYFLKKIKAVKQKQVPLLSDLFVKVGLPASVFLAFSAIELQEEYLLLPIVGFLIVVAFAAISYFIVRYIKLNRTMRTVFLVVMPTLAPATVAYPFLMQLFGEKGLVTISLFNIGNILFLFSIDKMIAARLSNHHVKLKNSLKQFFHEPVIWATIAGLGVSYFHLQTPLMHEFFKVLADASAFIIMMLLGISFEWKASHMKNILPLIMAKTGLGMMIGYGASVLFGFTGMQQLSLIIFALVPPSAVTYIFVAHENHSPLPAQFEAELLAFAMPIGAIVVGLLVSFQQLALSPILAYVGAGIFAAGLLLIAKYGKKM
ncbi:MAG: hypothetical protein Q7R76_06875 [Candidatus Woesearchaeota archaeon]|nr:hypothetical protein [Candidatus Woesearchaeota archaeon]